MFFKKFFIFFFISWSLIFTVQAQDHVEQTQKDSGQTTQQQAEKQGYYLKDYERGLVFEVPGSQWNVNAGQYSVTIVHGKLFDARAFLRKSWRKITSLTDLYDENLRSLKHRLPGAEMIKEKEPLKVGQVPALSMTYRDPSKKIVQREIVFIHKENPFELEFSVKEENFNAVKDDFSAILRGIQTF